MYSPVLNEKLIKTLYRMKCFYQKPMTQLTEDLILKSLQAVDKEPICKLCVSERNTACEGCYLGDSEKRKG